MPHDESKQRMDRRALLRSGAALSGLALASAGSGCATRQLGRPQTSLRPPGAKEESAFLSLCIRCGRCATVCEAQCIRFGDSLTAAGSTPYILPQQRACVLCMECGLVCPSGALERIPNNRGAIAERVRMGVAELTPATCWARGGRGVCRACWYACPYADEAIILQGPLLRPVVVEEKCVGCGLCAQACPPDADAIVVRPR